MFLAMTPATSFSMFLAMTPATSFSMFLAMTWICNEICRGLFFCVKRFEVRGDCLFS
jgi:hypothetical protein